jgi:hypothetical protein
MARIDPTPNQRQRLLEANANRCCVCKRSGLGLHLHHIDGDSSNTVDQNLAVLCVEDHDRHHRPGAYKTAVNHLELNPTEIQIHKTQWEAFVIEAKSDSPNVIATLSCFGTNELIHSIQLVLQWASERIEYKRSYHLLDGNFDRLTDEIIGEINELGKNIKIALINEPLPVEHCPCCGTGFSRTLRSAVVTRLTDPSWQTDSSCSIYVNPINASLAMAFFLRDQLLLRASLHLCQGAFLHYHCDTIDERVPLAARPSVRTQATEIVANVLKQWVPARVLIGTGDPDKPELIDDLNLPYCWEKNAKARSPKKRNEHDGK